MKLAFILLLATLTLVPCVIGQDSWPDAERAKLLNRVESLPKSGLPGPVAIWGRNAFPVIAAASNGTPEAALCAAAEFGKGRAVIYGHPNYLKSNGSVGVLLLNAVRWTSAVKGPLIGCQNVNLGSFLEAQGLESEVIDGPLLGKTLNRYDVVIADVQNLTDDAEGQAVQNYIKRGGGFIAAMTGWAFDQTSGGKTLNLAHGLRKALMPIGIAFTTESNAFAANEFEPL